MNSYLSTIIKKNDKICYEVEIEDESAPKLKLKKSLTTAQPARRPIFDVIAQLRSEKEAAANIKSEETTTINRNSYQIDKYNKLAKNIIRKTWLLTKYLKVYL